MATIFPVKVIGKAVKIPYAEKDRPTNAMRMVGDGVMGGDLRSSQKDMDIIDVVTTSSITLRRMSFSITTT